MKKKFNYKEIEKKWSEKWEKDGIYSPKEIKDSKNPFYNLWMFPYPSAEGLHAGHAFASTGSDVIGRYMRMNGKDVFQPIGFDSFGIHSENYAIKAGKHPREIIGKTTKYYEEQMRKMGHGYDWKRSLSTSDASYYKWTQWLFLQMFKAGLAYRKKMEVNFCPSCKTVLADEQVMTPKQAGKVPSGYKNIEDTPDGLMVCERCGSAVEKKKLEQWMFRITDYAEKLLEGLKKIDWSEGVVLAQKNWIGKKEGCLVKFPIKNSKSEIKIFTTRIDTIFGATFLVVSPEFAKENFYKLIPEDKKENITKYIERSLKKTSEERKEEKGEKTGEALGVFAVNPANGKEIPVWVSDYVLSDYGTGVIMAVPAHDRRDYEFAKKFNLPIVEVVLGGDISKSAHDGGGKLTNSGEFDGIYCLEAGEKIAKKLGVSKKVNYHLRDWLISRQRYWGPPIPMVFCKKCAKNGVSYFTLQGASFKGLHKDQSDWESGGWWPVGEKDLPVTLPEIDDYEPEGEGRGPLANHPEFYQTKCPHCGSKAVRETDVSDTFLDSSWYFLRYPSVGVEGSNRTAFDKEITERWLPVNLYFGGAEHAVLHLMYSRFVTKVLNDLSRVDFDEPFSKFFAHGLMIKNGAKMSKSRGNVVNPDDYIEKFGADTLRMYSMFLGPMDGSPDFRDSGIEGMRKFIVKVFNIVNVNKENLEDEKLSKNGDVKMHQTIKKVTKDIQAFHYNTAIASIMEYVNVLSKEGVSKLAAKTLVQLLAPFAPFATEEMWEVLGEKGSVHTSSWPKFDPKKLVEETVVVVVQVNGKLRGTVKIDKSEAEDKSHVISEAKKNESINKWIENKLIKKEIYVPGKILNFVV